MERTSWKAPFFITNITLLQIHKEFEGNISWADKLGRISMLTVQVVEVGPFSLKARIYIQFQRFQSNENLQTRQIDFQNSQINTVLQKELFSINTDGRPPTWAVAPWLWDHLRHAPGAATATAHLKCVQRIFLQLPKPINQKDHQTLMIRDGVSRTMNCFHCL